MAVKLVVVGVAVVAWIALTLVTVIAYNEYRWHGEQHAYIKQLQQREAQHEAEHQALRQLVQMVNEQQRRQAEQGAVK